MSWDTPEGRIEASVGEFVQNKVTGKVIADQEWLYTGSILARNGFRAQQTGDIAAAFSNSSALFNHTGENRQEDDIWTGRPGRLPPFGTKLRIMIRPSHTKQKDPVPSSHTTNESD